MSITGEAKDRNIGLRVGLAVIEPLIINPTKKQFKEILGWDREKEPEYLTKIDNVKTLKLDIWAREVSTGAKVKIQQLLQDTQSELPDKKVRYIDKKGNTSFWVNDTSKFKDWYLANDPWIARRGEVELYRFLCAHTAKVDKEKPFSRKIDWKNLMSGDVSELNEIKTMAIATNILATLTVRMGKVDGGFKEFQSVYHKDFLPATFIYFFNNVPTDPNHPYNTYVSQLLHPQHGCKEFFGKERILKLAHDYNPADNVIAGDSPIIKPVAQGTPAAMPAQTTTSGYSQPAPADLDDDLDFADLEDLDELDDNY